MKYYITKEATPHGAISWSHDGNDDQYCEAGEVVTLDWQPSAGWGLQEAHYTDSNNAVTAIDLTPVVINGKKVVQFVMPASNIVIGGTFKRFVVQDWGSSSKENNVAVFGKNGEVIPNEKITKLIVGTKQNVSILDRAKEVLPGKYINRDTGGLSNNANYKLYVFDADEFDKFSGKTRAYGSGVLLAFYNTETVSSDGFMAEDSIFRSGTGYNYATFENVPRPSGCKLVAFPVMSDYEYYLTADAYVGGLADLKKEVEDQENSEKIDFPQILNGRVKDRAITDEMNMLLIGSSWGVDTIAVLNQICYNLSVPVSTGNLYKSGGTVADYLEAIENNTTNTFFFNTGGVQGSGESKTVLQALQYKDWDIVIIQEGSNDSLSDKQGFNEDVAELLAYLKNNVTNPNCMFVINSMWTPKGAQSEQGMSYKVLRKLMKQTGIDAIVPVGSALQHLRETSVNNGNDIYRDGLHLDVGVGRFTASAAIYIQFVWPIYGVSIDTCSLTGNWDQAAGASTYPTIDVDGDNRAICIQAARDAVSNRFYLSE